MKNEKILSNEELLEITGGEKFLPVIEEVFVRPALLYACPPIIKIEEIHDTPILLYAVRPTTSNY